MSKEMYQSEYRSGGGQPYKLSCEVIQFDILKNWKGCIGDSRTIHLHSSSSPSTIESVMNNEMSWKDSNSNAGLLPQVGTRICSNCMTSQTPLWRSGPYGPKSLCNACGIRYRKETGLTIFSGSRYQ